MKVMFTIDSLNMGGAEHLITDYMIKLHLLGYETILLELYKVDSILAKKLTKNNIKVIPLYKYENKELLRKIKRRVVPYIAKYKVNKIVKEEKPDIIHINGPIDWLHGIRFPVDKVFYTFHTEIERDFAMRRKTHKKTIFKNAKKGMNFLVINQKMLIDAKRIIGSNKIFYLPNGVDIEKIQRNTVSGKEIRQRLGIPQDAFVVGHVGRIHPVKNHKKIVEIFEEVRKNNNNAYLILVGEGEKKYVENIKSFIRQKEIADYVVFTGMREDATSLMRAFDAFVLPSFQEGFPLVSIEAQALHIRSVFSYGVPDEVVCNNNCFKLDIHENSRVWADYVEGNFLSSAKRDIWEYDINRIVKKLIVYYEVAVQKTEKF